LSKLIRNIKKEAIIRNYMLEVSLISHLGIISRITLQLNHTNIKIWEHDYNTFEIMT